MTGYSDEWTTEDELRFLAGIGNWRSGTGSLSRRIKILTIYLKSMAIRKNWGRVSKDRVLVFVEHELARCKELQAGSSSPT
ncbi:MAG: hypothetical protein V4690_00300 [Patescibacteria group bacterium]